jgi:sugar transferase EpsL
MSNRFMNHSLKRAFDFCGAAALLLLLWPLIGVVWLAVRWAMGPGAIFRQARAGMGGRPFLLYKFRTMTDASRPDGTLLPDGDRLTPLGQFLRRASLDELPQLWNVLAGQMSFVGPRPLLMRYVDRYSPEQARRLDVTPGITGWAQVRGRNTISWKEKFERDVWYVDHWTVTLDLYILALTVVQVLRCEGISADGNATMCEFCGSAEPQARAI